MESIINGIRSLFETYGGQVTIVILFTIMLTNVTKRPIIKYAGKVVEATGYDKSVVTKFISLIPFGFTFLQLFIVKLVILDFSFAAIEWGILMSEATVYAAVAIATYEVFKKQFEAYATKKNVLIDEKEEEEKV